MPLLSRRSKQDYRFYSRAETKAWANRPYRFSGSLEEAVVSYRSKGLDADELPVVVQKPAPRRAALTNLDGKSCGHSGDADTRKRPQPQLCSNTDHPLRIGLKQRLYHRFDFTSPILDCMQRLHERSAGATCARSKKRTHSPTAVRDERKTTSQWSCISCGNKDRDCCVQHRDALVCPCGVVVCAGGAWVTTHRERTGAAEEDDRTQHADRVRVDRGDRFDGPPMTTNEKRNFVKYESVRTRVGSTVRGRMSVGPVDRAVGVVERAVVSDLRTQGIFQPREELKQQRVFEAAEVLFRVFEPVDHALRRLVRIDIDAVWTRVVRHSRCCTQPCECDLTLAERPSHVIAAAIFELAVDDIARDGRAAAGVDPSHVAELKTRMQHSALFSIGSSRAQLSTTRSVVEIVLHPDFDPERLCAPRSTPPPPPPPPPLPPPPPPPPPPPETSSNGSHKRARRSRSLILRDSLSSMSADEDPSFQIKLQKAVLSTFKALDSELKLSVKTDAIKIVQSTRVVSLIEAAVVDTKLSANAVAFCLLYATARAICDGTASDEPVSPIDSKVAHRLRLDLAHAEQTIATMKSIILTNAID